MRSQQQSFKCGARDRVKRGPPARSQCIRRLLLLNEQARTEACPLIHHPNRLGSDCAAEENLRHALKA
jgi:hypothetical protein